MMTLFVEFLFELEGQQIPSPLIFAINRKWHRSLFLHTASSSFTGDPCTSRITRSYSLKSTGFNSATATKSLRVLLGQPVGLILLAMLQPFSDRVHKTF